MKLKAPRPLTQRLPCRKCRINHAAATASWPLTAQSGGASFGSSMPEHRPTRGAFRARWSRPVRSAFRDDTHEQRQGVRPVWHRPPTSPRRNLPGSTAWQRARVAGSGRSCKAIVSSRVRHWSPRSTAMSSYNQQLPQSAPESKTPLQTMQDRHKLKPELFQKQTNITFREGTYSRYSDGCTALISTRVSSHWVARLTPHSKDVQLLHPRFLHPAYPCIKSPLCRFRAFSWDTAYMKITCKPCTTPF